MLVALSFDVDVELPYKHCLEFCLKHCSLETRNSVKDVAYRFLNDSFKIPVSLYFHPKVIATAAIYLAAKWRMKQELEAGFPKLLNGYPWYKYIDSSIESK